MEKENMADVGALFMPHTLPMCVGRGQGSTD